MTDDQPALFDMARVEPVPLPPVVKLSAGVRRTLRQAADLAKGRHPIGPRLHVEAAPHNDRNAPGRRCGNCRWRVLLSGDHEGRFPKCTYGGDLRISNGPATDVRAWWPGCTDHEWGDNQVSDDAARWVPTDEEAPS